MIHHLEKIKSARVLLLGDFMLDIYTLGSVKRISPEAPVPILHVMKEEEKAGGAGNTALNLLSLGMQVIVCGRVGDDAAGRSLRSSLSAEGADTSFLFTQLRFVTPVKKRMIADNQQLLRVDYEQVTPISADLEQQFITALPALLKAAEVVAISDYAKGFLSRDLLRHVITLARKEGIPVIVDPKGMDFSKYKGATVLKPNHGEAVLAAGLGPDASLDLIGEKILREIEVDSLMVTRSKEGISIFSKLTPRQDFPAVVHEVKDVTGAGDTVLAVVTASIASQLELSAASQLANVAAGLAIERLGCARISLHELKARLLEAHPA